MKAYILTEEDFEKLLAEISRDPKHGLTGGSSHVLSSEEKEAYQEAHRFYNHLIRRWVDKVKS